LVLAPTIALSVAGVKPVLVLEAAKIPIPAAAQPATTAPPMTAPAIAPGGTPVSRFAPQTPGCKQKPQASIVFGTTATWQPLFGAQIAKWQGSIKAVMFANEEQLIGFWRQPSVGLQDGVLQTSVELQTTGV